MTPITRKYIPTKKPELTKLQQQKKSSTRRKRRSIVAKRRPFPRKSHREWIVPSSGHRQSALCMSILHYVGDCEPAVCPLINPPIKRSRAVTDLATLRMNNKKCVSQYRLCCITSCSIFFSRELFIQFKLNLLKTKIHISAIRKFFFQKKIFISIKKSITNINAHTQYQLYCITSRSNFFIHCFSQKLLIEFKSNLHQT